MDHNLLVSELQSLVVESKRRNPEVKDASEAALEILRAHPSRDTLAAKADTLLLPIILGCKTKNAKIVGISIAALQRLVALGGVGLASLPEVLVALGSVAGQAVDIQLKILQTLLSVLTYCKDMHGDTLGMALLLCFRLQDSRVSVVSSTAAATLRQAIMVVFDRVAEGREEKSVPLKLDEEVMVSPGAMDAFCILSDLCLLTSGQPSSGLSLWSAAEKEKPKMLKLHSLSRTFGLELIESILSGYVVMVKAHPELVYLLRHSLHPLIQRLQAERPSFPVSLRICRILYVLVRSYADELPAEVESYLLTLIRMGAGDDDDKKEHKKDAPPWLHVLALEILRGICGDGALLQSIWTRYDRDTDSKLFARLVGALGHLIQQKPALLGVSAQMHGLGVPASSTDNVHAGYFDMGIGMVASAASVGVSAVSAMVSSGGGLGPQSAMKQRLVEQHEKTEAPAVPETYICLLAAQSLTAVAESISAAADKEDTRDEARGMAEAAWPALLAALSYTVTTDLSDALFADVLIALQDFTVACGRLDLSTPRDAFLNTLARCAVPPPVVSAMQSYLESPATPKLTGGVTSAENLGLTALTGAPITPPSLSERNMACLRSLISVAQLLASSLGKGWQDVLETLQNANYLLASAPKTPQPRRTTSGQLLTPQSPSGRSSGEINTPRPELLQALDNETIQGAVNTLFDRSRELDNGAFTTFVTALCRLSAEMIGMDVGDVPDPHGTLSPGPEQRRRTSGINTSQGIKSNERSFGLSKLRVVAVLNLERLVNSDPNVGWSVVTTHLLAVARHNLAPNQIRLQAAETLSELLLAALRATHEPRVQHQVFDVLGRQVDAAPVSNSLTTDYDVRSSGYQTLNQILESSGHSLEVGWPTIFGMLNSVCLREDRTSSTQAQKGDANLVRIAFPSLTLICTDFLSSLDADAMRQCITCLGHFGRQQDDVNITLAAINLLWTVSDAVQGEKGDSALWLYLLTQLLELARDPRGEVRSGAMQTLFRCVELYGASLSPQLWEDVFWKVVFPLLDASQGDEGQVLALSAVGSIFGAFLPQISALPSAAKVTEHLLEQLQTAFVKGPRVCSSASLKVLESLLTAAGDNSSLLEPTCNAFSAMGKALEADAGEPFTQDNLLALVRVGGLLYDKLPIEADSERARRLSSLLRAAIEYARSPDYRPDVDSLSPLQSAVATLIKRANLGASITLSDLAEYASLAYVSAGGKLSYVALSKFAMPALATVFKSSAGDISLYADGTVEAVLGAYALPIKLKYDCPPASKYGDDPPLWRTAMETFMAVLPRVVPRLSDVQGDRAGAIWAQIMDVYAALLLAEGAAAGAGEREADEGFVLSILDRVRDCVSPRLAKAGVPAAVVRQHAETLRRASVLYTYDVRVSGGTTAPVVPRTGERTAYWALGELVACASRPLPGPRPRREQGKDDEDNTGKFEQADDGGDGKTAALFVPSVLARFEAALGNYVADAKLRGQMPLSRVREDELVFVLRHLVTLRLWPEPEAAVGVEEGKGKSEVEKSVQPRRPGRTSPRSHLFQYYPLLLDLAFLPSLPGLWVLPSEHRQLFEDPSDDEMAEEDTEAEEVVAQDEANAGDGSTLIHISARDLARRCLEIVGRELGLG